MPKLREIVRQLDGSVEREKEDLNEALASVVSGSTETLRKGLAETLAEIREDLNEAREASTDRLKALVAQIQRKGLDATKSLTAVTEAIKSTELAIESIPKQKDTDLSPVIDSVDRLRKSIESVKLPETDIGPIMRAVERLPTTVPITDIKPVLTAVNNLKSQQWIFEIEREAFSDKIKRVVATRG